VDRSTALAWADRARTTRAALLGRLAAGEVPLSVACDLARSDDLVAMIKVLSVVESLPGWGKVAARRSLAGLGIAGDTPLADVDLAVLSSVFGASPP
jgi:hypothetical protein